MISHLKTNKRQKRSYDDLKEKQTDANQANVCTKYLETFDMMDNFCNHIKKHDIFKKQATIITFRIL